MKLSKFFLLIFLFCLPWTIIAQPEEVIEAYNLQKAIKNNEIEKVKKFISQGYDVNVQYNGRNALHVACKSGSLKMVQLMLDAGADINDRRDKGEGITTLQNVIWNWNTPNGYEIIKVLLENGAKVNEPGPNGSLPINDAIKRAGDPEESLKIATLLIDHKANLHPENHDKSPVRQSILHQRSDMLELLLKNGTDPDIADKNGYYPIHHAVKNKDVNSVKVFIKYGANSDVKDKQGKTALDYAEEKVEMMSFDPASQKKYQEIVKLLSDKQ